MDVYSVTNAFGEILNKNEVEELLKEIGISSDAITEGTSEAIEADAQDQGIINFEERLTNMAKKTGLTVNGAADKSAEDYQSQLISLGIPNSVIEQGENAIREYASKQGIKLPAATGTNLNIKF